MKKKNVFSLLKFLELLINARIAYNNIKDDVEAKKTADMFGKRSLVYFFIFAFLAGISGGIIYWSVTHFISTMVIIAIIGFIVSLYLVLYSLGFYILSFNLAVKQKKLNDKAVGVVALIFNILVIIALVVALIIAFL